MFDENGDKTCDIFNEQISHHPPINAFLIEDSSNQFTVNGYWEHCFKREFSGTFYVWYEGYAEVTFTDETKVSFQLPKFTCEDNSIMYF